MWQGRKEITLPLIVRSSCGVAALRPAGWPITCVALLPDTRKVSREMF